MDDVGKFIFTIKEFTITNWFSHIRGTDIETFFRSTGMKYYHVNEVSGGT